MSVEPDPIQMGNRPWDGVWRVERPTDYVPGLYRMHQIEAHHLLRRGRQLTDWAARFLQVLRFQSRPLSPTQAYWLRRLEQEVQP